MIQCLTNDDWKTNSHDILEMHRLRSRVFKGRLDWDVTSDNGLEWDRFDTLDPIYIVANDDAGRVAGTWRMLPTTGPYMLRDVFPQLMDGLPPPASPRIWEGSRFAVDCDYDGSKAGLAALSRTTAEIFCAVVELSMALGAEELVTVYDARIARLLPRLGVVPTWRGTPVRIGSTIAMAGRFDISDDVLATIRERTGLAEPVLPARLPAHAALAPAPMFPAAPAPVQLRGASIGTASARPIETPIPANGQPRFQETTRMAEPAPQRRAA